MLYSALPQNDVRLGIRLPKELKDRIDEIAKSQGCTTSAMIRTMLYGAVYSLDHPETVEAVKEVLIHAGTI